MNVVNSTEYIYCPAQDRKNFDQQYAQALHHLIKKY